MTFNPSPAGQGAPTSLAPSAPAPSDTPVVYPHQQPQGRVLPAAPASPAPNTVTIPAAEYENLRRGQMAHADYTRGKQELSRDRAKLLDERENWIREREAAMRAPGPTAGNGPPGLVQQQNNFSFDDSDFSTIEKEDPALGRILRGVASAVVSVAGRQSNVDQVLQRFNERDQAAERARREDALLRNAMSSVANEPGFDQAKVLEYMRENGLGTDPELFHRHVRVAYDATAGRFLGAQEQANALAPNLGLPPILGTQPQLAGTGLAPPQDVAARDAVRQLPWGRKHEAAARAMGYNPEAFA